jgi:alpha-amylase
LVVFLDTDGASGGVTNLASMSTGGTPRALTRSHNLSFATNFTPNLGIVVGWRHGDGQNFPDFDVPVFGAHNIGQGVYGLAATQATNFPGFNSTSAGAAISQWGDLATLQPGQPYKTNAANAGIEIALSKTVLGLTNGAIFRAAAIVFGPSFDGTTRYFSREAYGESCSGFQPFPNNFGTDATTLIGAPVYLSTNPPPSVTPVYASEDDVLLQGFYWNVVPNDGSWYENLASKAAEIASNGFTSVWFPPPQKAESGTCSSGYDPFDHYDLGEYFQSGTTRIRYGHRTNLVAAVEALRSSGVRPYVDIVPNHMAGAATSTYNYPHNIFTKTPADFYIGTSNLVYTPFHRQIAFGDDEVNQHWPHMRLGLEAWTEWLSGAIGFEGFRVDHSNGMEPWFQSEFLNRPANSNQFAVLEYNIDASVREMQTWVELTDRRASLFDERLHDRLVQMCTPAGTPFNMASLYRAGLAGVAPSNTLTFVENHDTIRPCEGSDNPRKLGIVQDKILAYAYILISEGYPTVFYHDYFELPNAVVVTNQTQQCPGSESCLGSANDGFTGSSLKSQINALISARKIYAAGTTSFRGDGNSNNVYVVRRAGGGPSNKPGCVLAINRASSNITVMVNTEFASTNLIDRVDTNIPPLTVTTTSSGTATFTVPGRGYRVLAP